MSVQTHRAPTVADNSVTAAPSADALDDDGERRPQRLPLGDRDDDHGLGGGARLPRPRRRRRRRRMLLLSHFGDNCTQLRSGIQVRFGIPFKSTGRMCLTSIANRTRSV